VAINGFFYVFSQGNAAFRLFRTKSLNFPRPQNACSRLLKDFSIQSRYDKERASQSGKDACRRSLRHSSPVKLTGQNPEGYDQSLLRYVCLLSSFYREQIYPICCFLQRGKRVMAYELFGRHSLIASADIFYLFFDLLRAIY